MEAAGRGGVGRDTPQAVHQKPWLEGNDNHTAARDLKTGSSAAWEAEVRRLTDMGIHPAELKVYRRTIYSWNGRVNSLNDEIASKLNLIGDCRRAWYEFKVRFGDKLDMENMVKQSEILMIDIVQLQKRVTSLGGQAEQIPSLFEDLPTV